jgi:hypothetical protein
MLRRKLNIFVNSHICTSHILLSLSHIPFISCLNAAAAAAAAALLLSLPLSIRTPSAYSCPCSSSEPEPSQPSPLPQAHIFGRVKSAYISGNQKYIFFARSKVDIFPQYIGLADPPYYFKRLLTGIKKPPHFGSAR